MRYLGKALVFALVCGVTWAALLPFRQAPVQADDGGGDDGSTTVTIVDGNYQDTSQYQSMTPTDDFSATPSDDETTTTSAPVSTSAIKSQRNRKASSRTGTGKVTAAKAAVAQTKAIPVTQIANVSIPHLAVNLQGRMAIVEATANMEDLRAETQYAWRLAIYNADDSLFSSKLYHEQAFGTNGGKRQPTFSEIVPAPPGKSHVVVTLYTIPKDLPVSVLEDDEQAFPHIAARNAKQVEAD